MEPSNNNEVNSSFFPPPPPRYLNFTDKNLRLSRLLLLSETSDYLTCQKEQLDQSTSDLSRGRELGLVDLRTLILPPNLDWIREQGGWNNFGDWEIWPEEDECFGKGGSNTKLFKKNLEGMPRLYPDGMERKDSLKILLNTLISSYLELLNRLGNQGPSSMSSRSDPSNNSNPSKIDEIVSHIELTSFNIHGLCNELRPDQAKETLKLMLREQAKEKRMKSRMILEACEELKNQLKSLKLSSVSTSTPADFSNLSIINGSSNNNDHEKEDDSQFNMNDFDLNLLSSKVGF
ncbi:MED7 protein-domain-containing protein [Phakopsora pachyrhizi]|nr:MED7 protein-domain-containing protein [Phakopsora pachyrhizi]